MSNGVKRVLVGLGGLPGSGKTTVAEYLRQLLIQNFPEKNDIAIICPDETRQTILNKNSPIIDKDLDPKITERVINGVILKAHFALVRGSLKDSTVLVASACVKKSMRDRLEKVAHDNKATFFGFWLDGTIEEFNKRADERRGNKYAASHVGSTHIKAAIIEEPMNWIRVDAMPPPEQVAQTIFQHIKIA